MVMMMMMMMVAEAVPARMASSRAFRRDCRRCCFAGNGKLAKVGGNGGITNGQIGLSRRAYKLESEREKPIQAAYLIHFLPGSPIIHLTSPACECNPAYLSERASLLAGSQFASRSSVARLSLRPLSPGVVPSSIAEQQASKRAS